jgi:hypothetical protein
MTPDEIAQLRSLFRKWLNDDQLGPEGPTTGGGGPTFAAAPGYVQEAIRRHWPADLWEEAAMIARCESGWRADAHNPRGEDSRGLFQINVGPGAHPELAAVDLYDPDVNARHAYQIYKAAGSWRPWWNCAGMLGLRRQ